jgi:EAL domain-containing protein (putative c-di-GMP-specific phosphodiesterase class I)
MLANQLQHKIWDDLGDALVRREFSLHYQPQIDVRSGLIVGGEALVRWSHPELGMVSPNQFIPMAEASGLMPLLGDWILRSACEQTRQCSVATHVSLRVAVNLSPKQLEQPTFFEDVVGTLQHTALHPEQLELEMPEQSFLDLSQQQMAILNQLRSLGVGIVLEDVGRVGANLHALMQLKFDKVKIDPLLVRQAHVDTTAQNKISSLVAYAKDSNVKILAEGIETQEQFDWICTQKPDEAQGYFFGRPQPAKEICAEYRASFELSDLLIERVN